MKSITSLKPLAAILASLERYERVFIAGCGTCATMCHTGGVKEVAAMSESLTEAGKLITGTLVIPTACDTLTHECYEQNRQAFDDAQVVLVQACAFGVQTIAGYVDRPAHPALDTLFFGLESAPGNFGEVCLQCGECVLAYTGGVCPITSCHKGLLNGPCGGTSDGKCEIDPGIDCAWTLIYERLKAFDRLDLMEQFQEPKNWQAMPKPGRVLITVEEGEQQ
jgi:ferredoxin